MADGKRYITPDILDVDGFIHVIKGKVICFKDEDFDLQNEGWQTDFCKLSDWLYVEPDMRARYGKNSVCFIEAADKDMRTGKQGMRISQCSFLNLPVDMQNKIREVCGTYA